MSDRDAFYTASFERGRRIELHPANWNVSRATVTLTPLVGPSG